MPSTSTLVDSIYTRRVSAGECYPPDLVKSPFVFREKHLLARHPHHSYSFVFFVFFVVNHHDRALRNPEL